MENFFDSGFFAESNDYDSYEDFKLNNFTIKDEDVFILNSETKIESMGKIKFDL